MNIEFKQLIHNIGTRTRSVDYIVIHDTGNPGKGADADAHFEYYNGGDRGASADFFVDDKKILQVNDYNKHYAWHCGDGHGKYGITNRNSVGIEICVNSDGNYESAFERAVWLTKHLMTKLNIPLCNVVRHYDASRKNCPATMSKNGWALWYAFKNKLTENEEGLTVGQYDDLKREIGALRTDVDVLKNKMVYAWVDDNMPEWARDTVTKLMQKGYLKGDSEGKLNLDDNMLRMLVINDRAGLYD